ncbi:MAG: sigma-54 dependent transcriptional regulator [Proteobacteria bacterium]|nr:sigma-54-dependent Fis family transcriptional regulator [Desulfobacula sp.]MBU3952399.1 sigma-54 dependent transcriptional regulator [Pseudomonadota bacterium]MBU4129987.1 sigma-54 dependent transcriptional regulator [Pseudomonadota bacterium]
MKAADKKISDARLLDLIARICHSIAFETTSMQDISADDPGKTDGDKRVGRENKEDIIKRLFALTDQGKISGKISSLAESFGLMLVKLEARELRQEELIEALKKNNKALEIAKNKLGEQNRSLVISLRQKYNPAQFVGQCRQMQKAKQVALNIARHPINTLILGASGTGKEVFAKMIHFNSLRAENPFMAINCTAIPEALFESEMFGIEKGVATGVSQRKGFFEQAHTGTVFLDEIGDMSLVNQAKLLRVLEEREVVRVGAVTPIKIDVKIISATNIDLKKAVEQGRFRQDLYYRLNVVELTLPPLKDRGDDILILAEKLLIKNCSDLGRSPLSLSNGARQCLLAHEWPGNVRELNNEMERAAALTLADRVDVKDLSVKLSTLYSGPGDEKTASVGSADPAATKISGFNLENLEQHVVSQALERVGNNKTKAAALLGITREGLRKKLLRFKLTETP